MKSSYLTNLVLLIIVIVLLWLSQREQPSSQQPVTLSRLTAAEINNIQIQRPDKSVITLQRQQDQWFLLEPFTARANKTRTDLLLSLLSAPVRGQFQPMDQASLDQFGLRQPESTILLNGQSFYFGGIEPLNKQRYLLHNDIIYLIDDTIAPLLRASAGSFVDNRLIAEQQTISRLAINHGDSQNISLSLQDGHWQSSNLETSSDNLKTLIDSWQHAYAMQVRHMDETALALLPEPQITIWLQHDAEPMSLVMTETKQTLQITNPSLQLQYDFPLALKAQLLPQPETE